MWCKSESQGDEHPLVAHNSLVPTCLNDKRENIPVINSSWSEEESLLNIIKVSVAQGGAHLFKCERLY